MNFLAIDWRWADLLWRPLCLRIGDQVRKRAASSVGVCLSLENKLWRN